MSTATRIIVITLDKDRPLFRASVAGYPQGRARANYKTAARDAERMASAQKQIGYTVEVRDFVPEDKRSSFVKRDTAIGKFITQRGAA